MVSKREVFLYFLKLGFTGFGGPVALAAIMQSEIVEKKQWVSRDEFDRAFPLIKAMPGALAVQTAAYLSYRCSGALGAFLAVVGLLLPASVLMVVLAILAPAMSELAWLQPILIGFQAGALAIISLACLQLAMPYKSIPLWWVYVVAALGLAFAHVPEPILIVGFGLLNIFISKLRTTPKVLLSVPLLDLIVVCLLAGTVVFGTGLAAVPWLEKQMVVNNGWISQPEFMQAVAFGQITPGPVLVTTTYIGYKISGLWGAFLATVFIYLPGYINMTTWFPRMVNRLSKKVWIRDFSQGALAGVVGTLIFVVYKYIPSLGTPGIIVFVLATLMIFRFKIPSWVLILASGGAGFITGLF